MMLKTKRLLLRPLTVRDLKSFIENINNINVARYMESVPHPYTKRHALDFLKKINKNLKEKKPKSYDFVIELKSEKIVIGGIGLGKIDYFRGVGTVGYWVGEKYWRMGYASEALKAVLNFAFNKLRLRRIELTAVTENAASNRLAQKFGFRLEGKRRKDGRPLSTGIIYDRNFYGLLKEEWKRIIEQYPNYLKF